MAGGPLPSHSGSAHPPICLATDPMECELANRWPQSYSVLYCCTLFSLCRTFAYGQGANIAPTLPHRVPLHAIKLHPTSHVTKHYATPCHSRIAPHHTTPTPIPPHPSRRRGNQMLQLHTGYNLKGTSPRVEGPRGKENREGGPTACLALRNLTASDA